MAVAVGPPDRYIPIPSAHSGRVMSVDGIWAICCRMLSWEFSSLIPVLIDRNCLLVTLVDRYLDSSLAVALKFP